MIIIILSINFSCTYFLLLASIQELMVENSDLRESLKSMQTELVNLLNHHNDDYENENNTEVSNVSHNFVFCCNPYFFNQCVVPKNIHTLQEGVLFL